MNDAGARLERLTLGLSMAALTWSAFAFGATYPWGYNVLLPVCFFAGGLGVAAVGRKARTVMPAAVLLGLGAVLGATLLQLVPFEVSTLERVSPAATSFLRAYDFGFFQSGGGALKHPLSVSPELTWRGLTFLAAFIVFFFGMTAIFSRMNRTKLSTYIEGLIFLGVALALVGIWQRATFNGRIYGFWQPLFPGQPFGPFMNRNHFAGWMLLMVPVGIAYFYALLDQAMEGTGAGWRRKLLWFGTPDANRVTLVGFGLLIMTFSLFMTWSRSGISSFVVGLMIMLASVIRRHVRPSRRRLALVYLAVVAVGSVLWAGVDVIAARFADIPGSGLAGRTGPWSDTAGIIRDFPLTGTGLNTFGVVTLLYQKHDLHAHYEEAHGDYLQLAAEGGALLMIPAIFAVWTVIREIRRRFQMNADCDIRRAVRSGAVIGLVSLAIQEIGEFSLQLPAVTALFAVICAMAIHPAPLSKVPRTS